MAKATQAEIRALAILRDGGAIWWDSFEPPMLCHGQTMRRITRPVIRRMEARGWIHRDRKGYKL